MDINIKKFWDECHNKNIIDSLSGCGYDETIDFLKLRDYIIPGNNVLEVGPGLGYVTRGLYDHRLNISCLDISKPALIRVEKYCEKTYTISDLDKLPSNYFDIIICNNVIQHVPTDLLIEELRHCIRSLKVSGVFAVEFVSNDIIEDMGINPSLNDIKGGSLCRTPRYLEKLIEKVGGNCELVVDNKCNINVVKGCHVFHVKK